MATPSSAATFTGSVGIACDLACRRNEKCYHHTALLTSKLHIVDHCGETHFSTSGIVDRGIGAPHGFTSEQLDAYRRQFSLSTGRNGTRRGVRFLSGTMRKASMELTGRVPSAEACYDACEQRKDCGAFTFLIPYRSTGQHHRVQCILKQAAQTHPVITRVGDAGPICSLYCKMKIN